MIIWLASYPKSGNTWLRAFLHAYQRDAVPDINRLAETSVSEANAAFFGGVVAPAEVQRLRAGVHRALAARSRDAVLVKTHNARLAVHGVALCTEAVTQGAVVVVRDPRDVAVSYADYAGLTLDETIGFMAEPKAALRGAGDHAFEYLSSWSAHVESWVAAPKRLLLRYEDMLADPARAFGRVTRFLGYPDDAARRARAVAASGFATLRAQEDARGYAAGGTVEKFFRRGEAGGWRTALSAAQAERIVADHGAMMRNFDYP